MNTAQRVRKKSKLLDGYIVYGPINEPSEEDSQCTRLNSVFYGTIDSVLGELKRRFSDNQDLISAITVAEELKEEAANYNSLAQLGVTIPPKEELMVAKCYLNKFKEDKVDVLRKLYEMKAAFPSVYNFLATYRVFDCSTAI